MSEDDERKLAAQSLAEEYSTLDFGCEYSANIPELLKTLNISLALTSYQAGRLMFVRSDGKNLDVNYKRFNRPMGLTASTSGITLGVFTQVINFQREDGLIEKIKAPLEKIEDDITAPRLRLLEASDALDKKDDPDDINYINNDINVLKDVTGGLENAEERQAAAEQLEKELEQKQAFKEYSLSLFEPVDERVDACFITRSSHYTGMINIHDIDWGEEGLWAVNSSFSCLCTLEPGYSFVPKWKPHFVSSLVPEDRCHLNGMGLKDGKPAFVTTFSTFDQPGMWRQGEKFHGTLMDVEHNEILLQGLTMPHSPRWHRDRVYFCDSGLGLVSCYDPSSGSYETIAELQGFARGIDFYGSILFVGLSKVRAGNVQSQAPLLKKYEKTHSGIWLINLTDNSEIGYIKFTGNVDQIYDVAVVPSSSFPELLEPSHPRMRNHFSHPELRTDV
ncbi:MAG: TIGR03032 family protein [Alteromonadaceae bacterium]|nr:MAG: TIGR03032 family protein [Alteromonadaceae bacterium]